MPKNGQMKILAGNTLPQASMGSQNEENNGMGKMGRLPEGTMCRIRHNASFTAIVLIALATMPLAVVSGLTSEERSELARKFKYYHRSVRPIGELNLLDTLNGTFFRLVAELELHDTRLAPGGPSHQLFVDTSLMAHYRDGRLHLRDLAGPLALPEEFHPWMPRIQLLPMESARGLTLQRSANLEPKTGHLIAINRYFGPLKCDFDAWKVPFERYKCRIWLETDQDERLVLRVLRDLRPSEQMFHIQLNIEHWPLLTLSFAFSSRQWQHALISFYLPTLLLFACALFAQWRRRKIQVVVAIGALLGILIISQHHSPMLSCNLLDLWLGGVFVHLVRSCLLCADLLLPSRRLFVFKRAQSRQLANARAHPFRLNGATSSPASLPVYSSLHYVSTPQIQPPPLHHPNAKNRMPQTPMTTAGEQISRTVSALPPPRRVNDLRRADTCESAPFGGSEPPRRKMRGAGEGPEGIMGREEREQAVATLLAEMDSIRREGGGGRTPEEPFRHADSPVGIELMMQDSLSEDQLMKHLGNSRGRIQHEFPAECLPVQQMNTWSLRRRVFAAGRGKNQQGRTAEVHHVGAVCADPEELGRMQAEGIPRRKRMVLLAIVSSFGLFLASYVLLVFLVVLELPLR